MTAWIMLAALVTALALCSLFVGLYALYCIQRSAHKSAVILKAAREESAAAVDAMQAKFESMAAELGDMPRIAVAEPLLGTPRPCMNLSKRSHALRLRRKGDSPEKIAESLAIPRQEVDLLMKVHDIVLREAGELPTIGDKRPANPPRVRSAVSGQRIAFSVSFQLTRLARQADRCALTADSSYNKKLLAISLSAFSVQPPRFAFLADC
jgi:hypothetical protein